MLSNIFLEKQLRVYPISSGSILIQKGGRISFFSIDLIINILEKNMIPILSGDVVVDEANQFSICSGDQIISYLSSKLKVKRTLFLTDVDGVYTEDPRLNPKTTLVREIKKDNIRIMKLPSTRSQIIDVTGLMEGKLKEIINIAGPVLVFKGNRDGNLLKALRGDPLGTLIK